MIRILYPQNRMVTEDTVITWAQDQLINDAAQNEPVCDNDEEWDALVTAVRATDEYQSLTLESARAILEDAGEVTFAR